MNEIIIKVKAINDTKTVFDAVRADAQKFGDEVGEQITIRTTTRIERDANGQAYARAGEAIGRSVGDRVARSVSQRIRDAIDRDGRMRDERGRFTGGAPSGGIPGRDNERVKVDVDIDRQSFLSRIASLGRMAGARLGDAMKTGLGAVFNGDSIKTIAMVILGSFVAILGGPAIGAAIASGILLALGGGAIAAGVVAAFKDPRIKAAGAATVKELGELFTRFGSYFRGPVENFLGGSGGDGKGGLIGVVRSLVPMVERLGQVLAPVAEAIGKGIVGFLQNALPPILRAIENSAPVLLELAESLPMLGEKIGGMFEKISTRAPEAAAFLNDLLELFGWLIESTGTFVANLTWMYGVFRRVILQMIVGLADFTDAVADAWDWMPGIGPKLRGIADQFSGMRRRALEELRKIDGQDVTVSVRFRVLGAAAMNAAIRTARILSSMGYAHGGIVGQAATGGARAGRTWVGEHGPELVDLPAGSRVHSNPDSMRMAGQERASMPPIVVQLVADARLLAEVVVDPMRKIIGDEYGGSVQTALGR